MRDGGNESWTFKHLKIDSCLFSLITGKKTNKKLEKRVLFQMRYDRSKWLIYLIALQQETFALWTVVIILECSHLPATHAHFQVLK